MIIFGASGHAKVIIDVMRINHLQVDAIFDDNPRIKEILGIPVKHHFNPEKYPGKELVIAIGNNKIRKSISGKHGSSNPPPPALIHPSVIISGDTETGNGTVILHNSVIQTSTSIGKYVIINTGATVDHDCILEDFVHIAPNSTLCGGVSVGEGTLIGAGAVVIPTIKIGKWCVIGAGAVVIRDVPDYSMVLGNPGGVVRNLKEK